MSVMLAPSRPQELILPNGLKVILLAAGDAPLATVALLYRVGSRNEAVGYTGAAHLLEHMLFKGTKRNNSSRGYRFMEVMREIGANVNANTWLDRTLYFETLPTGYIPFALELEADRMMGALISHEDKQSEMTVVRNELEQRAANPRLTLQANLWALAFLEHPYHHPTIGWRTDVENITTERLSKFYRTFYRPDNATLVIAGGIDTDRIGAQCCESFQHLRKPVERIPEVYTSEPPQLGERTLTIRWPEPTKMIVCGYHIPSALGERHVLSYQDLQTRADQTGVLRDACSLQVLETVLAAGTSSRLHWRLIDSGFAHDVWATSEVYRDPGLFVVGAAVQSEVSIDRVFDAILAEIEAIKNVGITEEELRRAKASLRADRIRRDQRVENLAFALAEWEARGGWRLYDANQQTLSTVTLDDVTRVAQTYLYEENRSVARLQPGMPPLFTVPTADVATFPENRSVGRRLPLPSASHSKAQTFASTISGGAISENIFWSFVRRDVAPAVHVRGLLQVGPTFSGRNSELAAVTARMLARGTTSRDRNEIEDRLRGIGAWRAYGVDTPGGNPLAFRFEATALAESLGEVIQILSEELSTPKFSSNELEIVRSELTGKIRLLHTDPESRARQRLLEVLYPRQNPNYECQVEQRLTDLQALTLLDLQSYHHQVLSRGRMILSIVGDSTALEVERRLQIAFAHLPQRQNSEPEGLQPERNPASEERSFIKLERKPNAAVFVGKSTGLTRKSPYYYAANLANEILCGHAVEGRLGRRLRVTEGLTYGAPGQFYSVGLLPGFWSARILTNPNNVDAVVDGALDELGKYAEGGASKREVVAAKNTIVGNAFVSLGDNSGIAGILEAMEYYALGRDYVDNLREEIEAVSVQGVCNAASTLFDPRIVSIVIAGSKAI